MRKDEAKKRGLDSIDLPSRAAARRGGSERTRPVSAFQHAGRRVLDRAEVAAVRLAGDGGAVACRLHAYAGLPASRILFVVDGFRYPDAAAAHAGSYLDRGRRALLEKAMSLGYDAIDLDPIFFERHRRTGERFEFARDGHWSGAAMAQLSMR